MRYAIFADIHSNLEAYQAFLEDAKKEKIDRYFCVGDIVGYGADPRECIELTKSLNCPVVCGNHDWAVVNKLSTDYFNEYAKEAVIWTQERLDDIDKNYLNNLDCVYQDDELTLVHGSLKDPKEFDYVTDRKSAHIVLSMQDTRLCFIGHTHVPGMFYYTEEGDLDYRYAPRLNLKKEDHYLINVGSIGQPRDGDWRACYSIYDTEKYIIQLKRLEYDVKKASEKIEKAGLPKRLSDRILAGR
ncbi:MAG: metallophosphoesterase family protein [Candidatus Omnitrophica bacterium]|nr:metallophosphoesterase family protein [Candidatus Omnitrophota bacterium]